MLQTLQDLRTFITNRFTPCVYCFATKEAIQQYPQITQIITSEWGKIMETYKNNIRIVFPFALPSPRFLHMEIQNPRVLDPNSKPFDFFNSEVQINKKRELISTKLIRQRFLEMDFLPPHCFADIPILSLVIVAGSEQPKVSINDFPSWAKPHISRIPLSSIRMNSQNLTQQLMAFYENVVSRLPRMLAEKEANYHTTWRSASTVSLFFTSGDRLKQMMVIMKYFADSRMMQQRFGDAAKLYKKLIEYKGSYKLMSQCKFMYALATIADGKVDSTEENLIEALEHVSSTFEYIAIQLTIYFVAIQTRNGRLQIQSLIQALSVLQNYKDLQFCIPFIMEQSSQYYKKRKAALTLALASSRFIKLSCIEHAARCLWGAFCGAKDNEYLAQNIGSTIAESQVPHEIDLSMIVKIILKSKKLLSPYPLKEMIERYPPGKCICGFVTPLVITTEAIGFPSQIPESFRGSWKEKATSLFAAYAGFHQFQTVDSKVDSVIGEPIKMLISLRCGCPAFNLENIHLLLREPRMNQNIKLNNPQSNNAEGNDLNDSSQEFQVNQQSEISNDEFIEQKVIDLKPMTVNPQQTQYVEFTFIPKVAGEYEITGIEFTWCNVVLQAIFDHPPVELKIHEDAPFLEMIKPKLDLSLIKENDIFQITLQLENKGKEQLKHLSLQTYGDSQFKLVEPFEREYTGFRFLKALQPGEKYTVRIAVQAQEGKHELGLLMPYWSKDSPPRYSNYFISYAATKFEEFPIIQRSCNVHINTKEYTPIGITSPYFSCAPHTFLDKDNHKAVLNLVTSEVAEKEPFVPPDFCSRFGDDGLRVWCKRDDLYCSQYLSDLEAPVAILIQNKGHDNYIAKVTNIGSQTIHGAKFSFLEPDEIVTFIVSGIELRIIDRIDPGMTSTFSFSLVFFDGYNKKRPPKIMIAADEFLAVSDLNL